MDKAIAVASRDPSWYGIDEAEVESRRRWASSARSQVSKSFIGKTVIFLNLNIQLLFIIIISLLTSCIKDSFLTLLGWHNEESNGIWQGLKYHKPC